MEQKGLMMLRILLNRYSGGVSEESTRHLPKDLVSALNNVNMTTENPLPLLATASKRLSNIHYSWLAPAINKLPNPLRIPTIGALPSAQAKGVCRLLKVPTPTERPAPPFAEYLLIGLFEEVSSAERLPAAYLPEGPLKPLTSYSKPQILRLIDLLGLRDLTQEMRLIVNKSQQEALLRCLNEEERRFFDFYMYKEQDKLVAMRLNLSNWNGDCRELRRQLHLRGMIRFGKALSGQNRDLLWYIFRSLDTGRAAIIEKYSSQQPQDNVALELKRQVVGLINYFSKNE